MLDDLALDLVANGPGASNRAVTSMIRAVPSCSGYLSVDTPYSSSASEVASQVRHWQQADQEHRVSKHALIRWWLQRHELSLDYVAAEFCLLSAAHGHGYPMYWASLIEPSRLAEIIRADPPTRPSAASVLSTFE